MKSLSDIVEPDRSKVDAVHAAVLAHIRESLKDATNDLATTFAEKDDDQLIRMMFSSYRGRGSPRGMRLSQFGLSVMKNFFKGYEITTATDERSPLALPHLLYLDANATMPYFCNAKGLVVYDRMLGMKLKLAGGSVAVLIAMDAD